MQRIFGIAFFFFLIVMTCTQSARAQAVGGETRRVHVVTTPPGMRAASSNQRFAVRTPTTFMIPTMANAVVIIDGPGFERATVPIPPGSQDLHLNVEMSRPVFEAGIALTAIFGAITLASAIWLAVDLSVNDTYSYIPVCWGSLGVAAVIAGALMIAFDRHREPTWSWGQ